MEQNLINAYLKMKNRNIYSRDETKKKKEFNLLMTSERSRIHAMRSESSSAWQSAMYETNRSAVLIFWKSVNFK
jgi:hypothetical protein